MMFTAEALDCLHTFSHNYLDGTLLVDVSDVKAGRKARLGNMMY